ncbi:phosphoadenosine phosphosulfate reductase family protein [Sansalvadorimonas sp. 2012CJ34-2]|uniref:Phosphoadenosine phosphosulfate reductase family protein n=1 Tax=Parendozoicomonas callyspongiae TaxID=2942213 RepID=A0ABT0PHV9_9GAMM|nr:phosphoadenosine phosphosulfate reductase family protein [Sansalvadorimonas sp. 2012CJ34-2]MCL6270923.1 phosphoadenosine phosphosulfate reductase family protein [Sansalvadorimonas sp. 2012CJ34-2]
MYQDLQERNRQLKQQPPQQIINDVLSTATQPVLTTNFGPHEAAIIHMATRCCPDIPVIWIDSGYGTQATYQFADKLIRELNLNIHIYHPKFSRAFRDAVKGGIPEVDTPEHDTFTEEVKLEPFNRAMQVHFPDIWLTAIRKEQTAFRQNLDILTQTQDGLLRVAPLFHWTELDLEEYLVNNDLPIEEDYFDPTKVIGHRECGLHTTR